MKKNIIAKVLMVVLLMLGIASSVWANGVASKKAVLEGDNYVFLFKILIPDIILRKLIKNSEKKLQVAEC